MKKILVLMGGLSSEREISILSGQQVANALTQAGYQVIAHDLTADLSAFLNCLKTEKPDVVFNALHGKYGEDGCIQGLLNLMKIPYTHSGVLASALGMNKAMTRRLVADVGITVATGGLMTKSDFLNREPIRPYVVKPNDDGSSVGVFIVRTDTDRDEALNAWPDNQSRLIEQYIPGRELSVAVLDGSAVGVVEIVPKTGYYDFKNKYTDNAADHLIPAPIESDIYELALRQAETVHHLLGCRGVSRSDFRFDPETNRLVFLEINTNPGMTSLSLVPDIVRTCRGISYQDLVSHLAEEATCDT